MPFVNKNFLCKLFKKKMKLNDGNNYLCFSSSQKRLLIFSFRPKTAQKQNCWNQGEALNVPTAFYVPSIPSSNNLKK